MRRRVIVIVAWLAAAAAIMAFGPYRQLSNLAAASGGLLDEAPRWTVAELNAHLDAIGARGRELYRAHALWDVLFAGLNALALGSWLAASSRRRWVLAVPALAFLLDLAENGLVLSLIGDTPPAAALLQSPLAIVTSAKLGAFSLGAMLALALTLIALGRRAAGTSKLQGRRTQGACL